MIVFQDLDLITRPEVYLPALGFLGLLLLSSWALFRATDRRKRYDDELPDEDQTYADENDLDRPERWRTPADWVRDPEDERRQ